MQELDSFAAKSDLWSMPSNIDIYIIPCNWKSCFCLLHSPGYVFYCRKSDVDVGRGCLGWISIKCRYYSLAIWQFAGPAWKWTIRQNKKWEIHSLHDTEKASKTCKRWTMTSVIKLWCHFALTLSELSTSSDDRNLEVCDELIKTGYPVACLSLRGFWRFEWFHKSYVVNQG